MEWKSTQEKEEIEGIIVVTDAANEEGKKFIKEMSDRYPELEKLMEDDAEKEEMK